jgi:GDP-D-mannose dehydratase
VTKARTLLGWESRHDLRSVVHLTMKYFVDRHRAK